MDSKFLLTFIISLIRENLSKIFFTSLDRIYLLWRVTRVDRDIWNHKILHELLNLISLINDGSRKLVFFSDFAPLHAQIPPSTFTNILQSSPLLVDFNADFTLFAPYHRLFPPPSLLIFTFFAPLLIYSLFLGYLLHR